MKTIQKQLVTKKCEAKNVEGYTIADSVRFISAAQVSSTDLDTLVCYMTTAVITSLEC